MTPTRPTPPWVLEDYFAQTFLEKSITVRYGFDSAPPPGVLNVAYAREYVYQAPSIVWATPEE
jgi:hypothetical protein